MHFNKQAFNVIDEYDGKFFWNCFACKWAKLDNFDLTVI